MININSCKEIFIEEKEKKYLVKYVDVDNRSGVVEYTKDDVGVRNICNFLLTFINRYGVNGFNDLKFYAHLSSTVEILLSNSSKKISLRTFNSLLKTVNNAWVESYIINRDMFFKNDNINNIVLNANPNSKKFEMVDDVVYLTLTTDFNSNICVLERDFIRNLLEERFSGKKINIDFIVNKNGKRESWVVTREGFKMTFPASFTFSTIVGIVNEHNDLVNESRKRR